MINSGLEKDLAHGVSELALAITDDRLLITVKLILTACQQSGRLLDRFE
jgi:hypothetical protein